MSAYDPTWESVSTHAVPDWYRDAKVGVFLHWGLYSVPGWAPQVPDVQRMLNERGPAALLRDNPYAEWYLNSMRITGSPTWSHHRDTYGADTPYDAFRAPFDDASATADLDALAGVCADAGAGYVVLTTKHHDGFTLWPADRPHPVKGAYHARRDLVGGVTAAVRARGLRMGLYYSGGYDWPYNNALLQNPADAMLAVPTDPAYTEYATAHVMELIDRYAPSVLWNDICWPPGGNLAALFAAYYNTVPDGVINDRWLQPTAPRGAVFDGMARAAGSLIQAMWRAIPDRARSLTFPSANHFDVATPEYRTFDTVQDRVWESTRGVGHSFGANRHERPEDIVTSTELVRSLCDIASKNGNLLIGIGPKPDGTIPDEQLAPLSGLGEWMRANGSAIRGTRPWAVAEATAADGTPVRFTAATGHVHALLLSAPGSRLLQIRGLDLGETARVRLLSTDQWLDVVDVDTIELPATLPVSPVHAVDLGPAARPTGSLRNGQESVRKEASPA